MKENLKIAADFAQKISKIKGILQVVLFGSVASGEDNVKSDIDIAVIHNRDKFEVMEKANKVKPEKVQTTFIHINDLYKETELVGALSGEGLLLYGSSIIIKAEKSDLAPKTLISYSLSSMEQTEKVKLNRALYGSISKSRKGKKQYITEVKGLINEPDISKLQKGVLIVARKKSFKIINLLKRFKAEYKEIPVWTY
ncbi:MAG: nucleotidyltransferase domain-containing protein [Nanoarchaeota archaeon]|nr:nucleotidyltransferase domain-containing protein [Nanoarchaeota archaeon]